MTKWGLILLLVLLSVNSHSQNYKKCYREINAGEYAEASNELYKKVKKKFNPLSYYFFGKLLSLENNSNRDLALAYSSIRFIYSDSSNYTLSKSKQNKYAHQFGFRFSNLKILHDNICRQALDSCRFNHTVKKYNFYINTFTTSPYLKIAIQERNELAWSIALSASTASSLKDFIKLYPDAEQIQEAKKLYDQFNYIESTVGKTSADYQKFLVENPENTYYNEAQNKYDQVLFEEETEDQSWVSYYRFLINHPDSHWSSIAWSKLKNADRNFLLPVLPDLTTYYNRKDFEIEIWEKLMHFKIFKIDSTIIQWFHACYSNHPYRNYFDSLLIMLSFRMQLIEHNGFYGYVNEKKDTIIYPVFDDGYNFNEGYAAVALGLEDKSVYGFINAYGQTVVSFSYDEVSSFKNGLAMVAAADSSGYTKYGFINPFEEFIIPMVYQDADTFSEGVTLLQNNAGMYGFLNEHGDTVLPFVYIDANDFSEGVAPVQIDSFWTFIKHNGTVSINKYFKGAFSFSDSLAAVKDSNGKWGYINHTGNWVIQPQFTFASAFKNGTAKVLMTGKTSKKNKTPLQVEKTINRYGVIQEQ